MCIVIQIFFLLLVVVGLVFLGVVVWVVMSLGNIGWLQNYGFLVLIVVIVLGILIGNIVYLCFGVYCGEGVCFFKQMLLCVGIIFYGFCFIFQDIVYVGVVGVVIDVVMLLFIFGLVWLVGIKLLKLDCDVVLLIGVGSLICGVVVVMVIELVLCVCSEQVIVVVLIVVIFGLLVIFFYLLFYMLQVELVWGLCLLDFGVYIGFIVYEVVQVLVVVCFIDQYMVDVVVIIKMVCVMMLVFFLLMLLMKVVLFVIGYEYQFCKLFIFWFVFVFIGVVVFNFFFLLLVVVNQLVL